MESIFTVNERTRFAMSTPKAKHTILVVDDAPVNIDTVKEVLSEKYIIQAAVDGKTALKIIQKRKPDLILLDIMMPEMDGFEICKTLKANKNTRSIPVIFLTAVDNDDVEAKGLVIGGADYVRKPFNPSVLLARVRTHLELKEFRDKTFEQNQKLAHLSMTLKKQVKEKTQEVQKIMENSINFLISLVEMHQSEVGGHGRRVSELVQELARYMQISEEEVEQFRVSGLLHDIGKLSLPEMLFSKISKWDNEKEMLYRQHPEMGEMLVKSLGLGREVSVLIKHHHERWDGSGYPAGLSKSNIPLGARVIGIVDMYDKITYGVGLDNKPYIRDYQKSSSYSITDYSSPSAPGLAKHAALHFIGKKGFSWYDHNIVQSFLEIMNSKGIASFAEGALTIENVKPGMRLARPIIAKNGQPLLPHGTVLESEYLDKLKSYYENNQVDSIVYVTCQS